MWQFLGKSVGFLVWGGLLVFLQRIQYGRTSKSVCERTYQGKDVIYGQSEWEGIALLPFSLFQIVPVQFKVQKKGWQVHSGYKSFLSSSSAFKSALVGTSAASSASSSVDRASLMTALA